MELLCIEKYNDIRFTLNPGDTTEKVPYLDDAFKLTLLNDYPSNFKLIKIDEAPKEFTIELKEDKLKRKITKK